MHCERLCVCSGSDIGGGIDGSGEASSGRGYIRTVLSNVFYSDKHPRLTDSLGVFCGGAEESLSPSPLSRLEALRLELPGSSADLF